MQKLHMELNSDCNHQKMMLDYLRVFEFVGWNIKSLKIEMHQDQKEQIL